jgi:hypothetical protein
MQKQRISLFKSIVQIGVFFIVANSHAANNWQPAPESDQNIIQQYLVKYSDLIDPVTPKFHHLYKRTVTETKTVIWCGQINVKNRMGTYTGWTNFNIIIASDKNKKPLISVIDDEFSATLFNVVCKDLPK